MDREIITKDKLDKPKIEGIKKIAEIVKGTLGPGGLPVIIQRLGQSLDGSPLGPRITKDGVSVAEECFIAESEVEDVIVQAVKSICRKTNTDAGDGTTTAIVLGEAIHEEIIEALSEDSTLNPQLVKEDVEVVAKRVLSILEEVAESIDNDINKVAEVATISANGDQEIGSIISQAFQKVGAEGVVTVDEGSKPGLHLDVVDGYQFDKGAQLRDAFFNDKNKTSYEAEDAYMVFYDGKLLAYTDVIAVFKALIEGIGQENLKNGLPPVVLVANEFSREVLQFLLIQRTEQGMNVCAVEGPHVTHVRTGYYDDLAYYTGGTRMGNGNRSLTDIKFEDIGIVEKIVVDKYKTTLYGGQGHEEAILERVDQLKAAKEVAESPYDAQVLSDRVAALTSGVAKIGVGGHTELEIKEKYDRIEDALNASRAALEEGVVPGGGTTLLRIANSLSESNDLGSKILSRALKAPFYQILSNIGLSEEQASKIEVELLEKEGTVYDARSRKVVPAMESGIIDPVKVTRTALENAVSIAALLSTAGGAIIYKRKK